MIGMFYNEQVNISMEKWCEILADSKVTTENDLRVLKFIYKAPNHEATSSEIASYLEMSHYGSLNLQVWRYSERIVQKAGIKPPIRKNGSIRWWHVPFLGYDDINAGRFPWIMRQELVLAYETVYGIEEDEGGVNYIDADLYPDIQLHFEGEKKSVLINRYERSRKARIECLKHYGYRCLICGFDFEEVYGSIGKNKIHIHHIIPIAKIGMSYVVDPIKDLQPVCPNCHTIIHSKIVPFTIEEVKAILKTKRSDV